MPNLTKLDISEVTIETLPNRAFYQSSNIQEIILPQTLTSIAEYAFYQSSVKSVYIPNSVTVIDSYAFQECKSLSNVSFEPDSKLTGIHIRAFYQCSQLESIVIPANVEEISSSAFYQCSSLHTVTFEKNSKLKLIGGDFLESGAFAYCAIKSIKIPASVEIIEPGAFRKCQQLKSVVFEDNSRLQTIGGSYYNKNR